MQPTNNNTALGHNLSMSSASDADMSKDMASANSAVAMDKQLETVIQQIVAFSRVPPLAIKRLLLVLLIFASLMVGFLY